MLRRPRDPESDRALARVAKRWVQLDEPFETNGHTGPGSGPCALIVEHSGSRLVVAAPHSVRRTDADASPLPDGVGTGGLALALAEHLGGSAIALRRDNAVFGAAGHDPDHPLTVAATPLVDPGVVFIELIGTTPAFDHAFDVVVGIGAVPTVRSFALAERFANLATRHGIAATVTDDETEGAPTMAAWALTRGADALRFDIAAHLRTDRHALAARVTLLRTFVQVFGPTGDR